VRDNRRVNAGGVARGTASPPAAKSAGGGSKPEKAGPDAADAPEATVEPGQGEAHEERVDAGIATPDAEAAGAEPDAGDVSAGGVEDQASGADASPEAAAGADTAAETEREGASVFAELAALRSDLDELTRDLQRVTAEYANYRKRVDRDRTAVQEQATGTVLSALLPVLDDLDRARAHDDLVGPFAAVADQLTGALGKFGLTAFGETGDAFDPQLHEAVSHTSSPDVTETTCVEVMRRGYLLGGRLLRPALVGVADPE
jgi:molecular chaperone GrpE